MFGKGGEKGNMANSQNMNTSNDFIKYRISVTQKSQDIVNNKSSVQVSVFFWRTNTGYESYGTGTVYCKINGTTYSASVTSSQKITSGGITLFDKTVDVPHNSDGTKTLTCSAWISHEVVTSNEQSYSQTLTTIPRASGIDSFTGDSSYLNCLFTVKYTPKTSAFYYKLRMSIPNVVKIFDTTLGQKSTNQQTTQFYFSESHLASVYSRMPSNLDSLTIGAVIETYSDAGYTNKIGESAELKLVLKLPTNYVPTISSLTLSDPNNLANTYGGYVQNKSKVKVQVASAGIYNSTIAKTEITVFGTTVTTNPYTTNTITEGAGSKSVTVKVTDTRGRTATRTASFTVHAYASPTITSFSAIRCNSSGTADDGGSYMKITYAGSITNIGSKNINGKNIIVRYKDQTTSTWTNAVNVNEYSRNTSVIVAANTEKSYDVSFVLTDSYGSTERTGHVSTAFTLMDFNSSGKGMAIGKVSESDKFEVGLPAKFSGGINGLMNVNGVDGTSNIIDSTTKDTVDNWKVLGNNVYFYSKTGCLIDQPSQWGFLQNFTTGGAEIHQIWYTQATGDVYHRGGNASGWSGSWRKLMDSYTVNPRFINNSNKRGTAPSSDQWLQLFFQGKDGVNYGGIENGYKTSKENRLNMIVYKGTDTSSTGATLTVGFDSSGNPFSEASCRFKVVGALFVGKNTWNDANTGWYLGTDGTAHVTASSGGGIYFHWAKNTNNTSYISENKQGEILLNGSGSKIYLGNDKVTYICNDNRISCVNYANNAYRPVWASAFSVQSSKLVKENIENIDDEEAKKILNLRPVSFDYKECFGGEKGQFGLIAEETLDVIPSCVNVPNDYDESNFDEEKGISQDILSIDYSKLVPHLIKMIQIQQEEIDQLKEEIKKIRN